MSFLGEMKLGTDFYRFPIRRSGKKYYRRELLHLLKRRWHELSLDKRELVERRLVNGRARYDRESQKRTSSKGEQAGLLQSWIGL